MAKIDLVRYSKTSQDLPKLTDFRDPVSGKKLVQNPQGEATPLGSAVWGPIKSGDE
jgi:hypothetical protein